MKRYQRSGGESRWDRRPAEAPQPGALFAGLTAIVIGIGTTLPTFVAIVALGFFGWAPSAALAVATVAGALFLRRTHPSLRRSLGTGLMVAGLAATFLCFLNGVR